MENQPDPPALHKFLTENTQELIARTRAKVAARTSPLPTEAEMKNGVPLFLAQLIDRLRLKTTNSDAIEVAASAHGGELHAMGFSVSQVVHGYGDVCQAITQLADEMRAPIAVDEFQTFNACLDDAIAHSVTEFERLRDESVAYQGTERAGALAHEMGNRVTAALVAFNILQKGTVAIGGSTGAVLGRSLRALRILINNSLVGVRLDSGFAKSERVSVAELIEEVESEASMGADAGDRLLVSRVAPQIEVQGDRRVLSAAISNLVQNAFKFSPHGAQVALRTTATAERVILEIEDRCGGLPPGDVEDLFRPFEQRNANRSGLGLGLAISRRGVEAGGGKVTARDRPGQGCIFSIDLPRSLPA